MKKSLSLRLVPVLFAVMSGGLFLAPARAADVCDNAYINQDYPNGSGSTDRVASQIVFNSNQALQDIVVLSTGKLGVNPVTRGNATTSVIASGSAVSLTTATPATVTSLTLGVGTWRIYGYLDYSTTSATTTLIQSGFGTTTNSFTNTLQTQDTFLAMTSPMTTTSALLVQATPWIQFVVASGTKQVFMVAQLTFSAGSAAAYGSMYAIQIK